jgi:hypothetical protein
MPIGVLLVLPAAWEAGTRWRREGPARRWLSVAGVLSPLVGLAAFMAWAGIWRHNAWGPLTQQTRAGRHGGLSDPFGTLLHDARGAFHGHVGTALHVPWVIVALVLLVIVWRRLPISYGIFATAVLLAAVSGTNLDSFERYTWSAFPLVIAAGTLTASPRVERVVLVLLGAGLAGYALLAFLNLSVP